MVSHLEGFDLARELPASFIEAGSSLGPNVWPSEVPHFQQDVYQLYDETTVLSYVLFESFAEMLGLPSHTFSVSLSIVSRLEPACSHCLTPLRGSLLNSNT